MSIERFVPGKGLRPGDLYMTILGYFEGCETTEGGNRYDRKSIITASELGIPEAARVYHDKSANEHVVICYPGLDTESSLELRGVTLANIVNKVQDERLSKNVTGNIRYYF